MVCYYGSWAVYRNGNGKFDVEDIDPAICTHIIFGFAGLDQNTFEIKVLDPYNELCENWGKCGYDRFTALKQKNTDLKALLAIGGWNEGSDKYSTMASDPSKRATFIASTITLLKAHNFDGLDMDWEYPTQRDGNPEDWANYIALLSELKTALKAEGMLLTAAVSAGKSTIDAAYDVPGMSEHLDFINLMAYDLHGAWETFTHHHAALYAHPDDTGNATFLNVDYAVNYWLDLGAPKSKLVLGMGTYGRCWSLNDGNVNGFYAPANNPGYGGPYTRSPGFLGYNEICEDMLTNSWTVVHDPAMHEPYAYYVPHQRVWCGYDDPASVALKASYAREKGLVGAMVWSVETDDFRGLCHPRPFELIKTIVETFTGGDIPEPPTAPTTTVDPAHTTPSTTPRPTPPPSGNCDKPGYNVNTEDCRFYVQCVANADGTGYDEYPGQCAEGTLFNPQGNMCDWEESVCALGICPNNCS